MDWCEKVQKAMDLLAEGCNENNDFDNCWQCPFVFFCDLIKAEHAKTKAEHIDIPETWLN